MFRNYFKIAWRNFIKRKTFSFINVFGLALSIACCILICTYLYSELNYDTYSKNANQLYRVELHLNDNGSTTVFPNVGIAVGQGIKEAFPEALAYTRSLARPPSYIKYKDKQFKEERIAAIDSNFLKLFSIPLIEGDINQALVKPNSIVISRSIAKKYFGDGSAMGKTLSMNDGESLIITGVIDEIPSNSHFHYNIFLSMSTLPFSKRKTWSNIGWATYLLLNKNTNVAQLESKIPKLVEQNVLPEIQEYMGISMVEARKSANNYKFLLRPITSIHLYSHTKYEIEPGGDIQYVYIFGALVFFILALACVNFTNLATASATSRSREVGIRKVMGSKKKQLILQFLSESVLISLFAMVLAFGIISLVLPWFNQIAGEERTFWFFLQPSAFILIFLFTVFVGLLAGIYPAFFLSSFKTISILKGSVSEHLKGKSLLRNSLVIFQFSVSLILIIATMVVYKQLNYMQDKKIGYNKDHVIVIPDSYLLGNNQQAFKQDLLQDSRIADVSISYGLPADPNMDGSQIYPQDKREQEAHSEIHTNIYNVDYNYISTMGMHILKGRNFSKSFPTDSSAVVINEAAVKALGWNKEGAIGQSIARSGAEVYNVIGIVEDFQYSSAKNEIAPLIMLLNTYNRGSIIIRSNTADVKGLLTSLKNKWASLDGKGAFSYSFLDENYNNLYKAEERNGQLFSVFALVAIIIASIGLLGLIAFTAQRRKREIGVRKVLGASVKEIVFQLIRDFIKLIFISIILAIPIAWYAMAVWLQNFAYRTSISWWIFAAAGILTLSIAVLTISFQAIKAASANPVKSLRTE